MITRIRLLLFIYLFCTNSINGILSPSRVENTIQMDMNHYQKITFDSLITDISCTKLSNTVFDFCTNMVQYKDFLYFMGSTMAGKNVYIYSKSGKFIKEITFSDALIVNSMCIVPELEELWVVSRFKIINKFKLDGAPVKKVSLPFPCAAIIPTAKQDFLVYSGGANTERGHIEGHFMALTDFKSIHKLYLPKWGKKEWLFAPYNLYTTDADDILILPDNTDTIYRYDTSEKEILPYYSLDFHGEFLTRDKYPKEDAGMAEIIDKKKYIHNCYSFYFASEYLFFKLMGKRDDFCAIRCKDNILFSFDRLFDNFRSKYVNPFIGSDKNNLYLLVRENDLAGHYLNIKCTYPAIRKMLPGLLTTGNDWILLTIKIKE